MRNQNSRFRQRELLVYTLAIPERFSSQREGEVKHEDQKISLYNY